MKNYEKPTLTEIIIDYDDVILTSPFTVDDTGDVSNIFRDYIFD